MADDLDDEWWVSQTEDDVHSEANDEEAGSEDEDVKTDKKPSKKRKQEQNEKKKKKKKTLSQELNDTTPKPASPQDLIGQLVTFFKDKLAAVQLDEICLQDDNFLPVHKLDVSSSDYLNDVAPNWSNLISDDGGNGSPRMLILCGSAIRCVQLIRDIANFKGKKSKVVKLFAKHMKVKEQSEHLSKSVVHLGVGTPNRVNLLIDSGSLKLKNLKYVILDWTWRDQKLKRMIDQVDIKTDLMKLLHQQLIPLVMDSDKGVKLGLL